MIANSQCAGSQYVEVYLYGAKLDHCIQADEEAGIALIVSHDSNGKAIPEIFAGPEALCWQGVAVEALKGDVEIRIDVTPEDGITEDEVRRQIHRTFHPLKLEKRDGLRITRSEFDRLPLNYPPPGEESYNGQRWKRLGVADQWFIAEYVPLSEGGILWRWAEVVED